MAKINNNSKSTLSIAPTRTSTKTALNYLHTPNSDKIQLISQWISTGKWYNQQPHTVGHAPQIELDPYQIAEFLHFVSPVVALHLNDVLAYGVIDTGCATR